MMMTTMLGLGASLADLVFNHTAYCILHNTAYCILYVADLDLDCRCRCGVAVLTKYDNTVYENTYNIYLIFVR